MTESGRAYQGGDRIDIGGGETIILGSRNGRSGTRWNWVVEFDDVASEGYWPTPEDAITDAMKTLNAPACRHRQHGWCPDCHDLSNA